MLKREGLATIYGGGKTREAETFTCCHCGNVRYLKSNDPTIVCDPGGICRKHMGQICSLCIEKDCLDFEEKLTIYERRQDLFKKLGLEL